MDNLIVMSYDGRICKVSKSSARILNAQIKQSLFAHKMLLLTDKFSTYCDDATSNFSVILLKDDEYNIMMAMKTHNEH